MHVSEQSNAACRFDGAANRFSYSDEGPGNGSSLHTFCRVLKALGREGWLDTIAPVTSINPLMLTRQAKPRQRASKPRKKRPTFEGA
jgi:hypothetical protein